MIILIVIVVLVLLVGLIYVLMRNSIIASRNRVDESWSGIDVQLKRRHDLVPNLVESVKGYAKHEKETFENVTKARSAAVDAKSPPAQAASENILTSMLGRLMVVAEQYPELRATENFQQLQNELSETENQIQITRRVYNDTVQTYNTFIQIFPPSVIANSFGFEARQFYEAPSGDREAPEVSFGADGSGDPGETAPATETK